MQFLRVCVLLGVRQACGAGADYRDGLQSQKSRHSWRSGKIFERSRPPDNQMTAPKGGCSELP